MVTGKTVGIDATTLQAKAGLRSIVRRDTGERYQDFLTKLAQASGIETPTRADLARIDRTRKKKDSNDDWTHPHDPDAKIMRRVHLRGHTNLRERLLIHAGGFNFGLLMRRLIGVGAPRGCKGGSEPPWPSWCSFAPSGSPRGVQGASYDPLHRVNVDRPRSA